ncbi:MAG: LamG domain-containing protein, partial [Flavipsychrobacter sp.]|nr:LamG domain-containing protein [Flavipsychrobacter sp.]
MKKLSILFAIIFYFPLLTSAQTLIGSWNFNGNANDGSGNALNGTVYNATLTSGQAGTANTAYHFNGMSSHIDVPYSSLLNLTTWTIQMIIKVDSFNSNTCQEEDIINRGTAFTGDLIEVGFNDNTHDGSCAIYSPNYTEFLTSAAGTANITYHDGNYIQLNTWYCMTATFDGNWAKTYLNGIAVDSAHYGNQYSYGSTTPTLVIGYYPSGGSSFSYRFNGDLDDLKIWSGALPDSAIANSCGVLNAVPPAITVNQPFTDTLKCAGVSLSLPYTKAGFFGSTNTFTLQLSNSSGSFSSPVNIGSVTSTSSGTITGTIPSTTAAGTG